MQNRNTFSDSNIEPLFGIAAIVVPAGPALPAGYSSSFFVDDVGQSSAGNIVVVEGDTNFVGGVIPQGQGFELVDLCLWARLSDFSASVTEAALYALGNALRVRLWYADQAYELGPLARFFGPLGPATGLNNQVVPTKISAMIPGMEGKGFIAEPNQRFKVELKATRALAAGVAAATYVFHAVGNRRLVRRGPSAVKQ